ncbi:MAG: acetyl-CoA carboxylase carboxyltransferase subunit alpha [Candidatus Aminicenantes bacterium]|nr:acetyl-CoA carboxylase carboxyltransferase subunit alpha [Candidatus Aminicenantes bacterium]
MSGTEDYYSLEKNILEYRKQLDELAQSDEPMREGKILDLKRRIETEWSRLKPGLSAVHIVQIARHPKRPYTLDYLNVLVKDFIELHGDRRFADDPAMVCGFGFYRGRSVCFVGHQKGRTTRDRLHRNFGQPNPEGYRKALRVMKLAEKFGCPVVSLVDTQGAAPGIGAEERGQAEAIAYNLREMSMLRVPIVVVVIGEGGSGGALAVAVGDRVLMLENSFYSVISPEGCAAILWKDQSAVKKAAENLKIRASDLLEMGVIDDVIPEPPGGAHIDPEETYRNVDLAVSRALEELSAKSVETLLEERYRKFRAMGVIVES